MNLLNNNKKQKLLQQISQNWLNYINAYLPDDIDKIMRESGSVKRFRGVTCGIDLLKVLFLYAVSGISMRMLSVAASSLDISTISPTAWRKRFSSMVPFLQLLLSKMFSSIFTQNTNSVRNVYLVDASIFRQEGKEQKKQRVHMCYNLNENRMSQLKVTDIHTAESLSHFSMKQGDIFIADGGYGTLKNFAYVQEQKADTIIRMNCNLPIYDENDKRIDIVSYLKEAEKSNESSFEIRCYVKYNQKKYRARVILGKLPKEKAIEARKRKKKKAMKTQHKIKESTLLAAGYTMLITSLGMSYDREEILYLYKSRWQVELLFKRLKQNFEIQLIRSGNEKYAEMMIYLWLIIWMMVEKQTMQAEIYLENKKRKSNSYLTSWDLCQYFCIQIKEILNMSWSLLSDFKDEYFEKHLSKTKGRRINQNEYFRHDILPGLTA